MTDRNESEGKVLPFKQRVLSARSLMVAKAGAIESKWTLSAPFRRACTLGFVCAMGLLAHFNLSLEWPVTTCLVTVALMILWRWVDHVHDSERRALSGGLAFAIVLYFSMAGLTTAIGSLTIVALLLGAVPFLLVRAVSSNEEAPPTIH